MAVSRLREMLDGDRLLKATEVAELFRVDPKTVSRWAVEGKLNCIRTPGGHRRYRESDVHYTLAQQLEQADRRPEAA